jgi:hypothetical protein
MQKSSFGIRTPVRLPSHYSHARVSQFFGSALALRCAPCDCAFGDLGQSLPGLTRIMTATEILLCDAQPTLSSLQTSYWHQRRGNLRA